MCTRAPAAVFDRADTAVCSPRKETITTNGLTAMKHYDTQGSTIPPKRSTSAECAPQGVSTEAMRPRQSFPRNNVHEEEGEHGTPRLSAITAAKAGTSTAMAAAKAATTESDLNPQRNPDSMVDPRSVNAAPAIAVYEAPPRHWSQVAGRTTLPAIAVQIPPVCVSKH